MRPPPQYNNFTLGLAIERLEVRQLLELLDAEPRRHDALDREHQIAIAQRGPGAADQARAERGAHHAVPQARGVVQRGVVGVQRPFLVERRPLPVSVERGNVGAQDRCQHRLAPGLRAEGGQKTLARGSSRGKLEVGKVRFESRDALGEAPGQRERRLRHRIVLENAGACQLEGLELRRRAHPLARGAEYPAQLLDPVLGRRRDGGGGVTGRLVLRRTLDILDQARRTLADQLACGGVRRSRPQSVRIEPTANRLGKLPLPRTTGCCREPRTNLGSDAARLQAGHRRRQAIR